MLIVWDAEYGLLYDKRTLADPVRLEIKVRAESDRWSSVSKEVFRSWSGERRLNGQPYFGPVYLYLTNEPYGAAA